MILSKTGQIVTTMWKDIPKHFTFVTLDEFVVMPNHVHGIIHLSTNYNVKSLNDTSLGQTKNKFMSTISPKSGTLGTIIRSFKSAVSKNVHQTDSGFSWQPRYYDHIIHSAGELNRIRNYITNNPINWDE